ncbi:hypothetical protein N826_40050 [Skermanella aerolata KACC 11604]|nr:hypothetical protein N826_40050 [Skermanella aerolata KACC 11604]
MPDHIVDVSRRIAARLISSNNQDYRSNSQTKRLFDCG